MAGDGHKHGAEARIGQQRLWECVVRALVTHSLPQCTIKKNISFDGGSTYKFKF
jgi:hypothetical protein